MRTTLALSLSAVFALSLLVATPASATDPDVHGMKQIFADMEKALKAGDEDAFKKRWVPLAYEKNLVGSSGLSGKSTFEQGSRKGWFLKPDMQTLGGVSRGEPWIVRCDIWSWKKNKAVDAVWVVFATHRKVSKLIGSGENKKQVEDLARRWLHSKPLEPPTR